MNYKNDFIKNQDAIDDSYALACHLLGMLLKDKDERPSYFKKHIDKNWSAEDIHKLSRINNVIIRVIDSINGTNDKGIISEWDKIATDERRRCERSVGLIKFIAAGFEKDRVPYAIIKTLDSYPDFGNDVDIFVAAPFESMRDWVREKHGGRIRKRKISEVMCGKMSVDIPGQPLLELHCERMGQVGEEPALAESMIRNRKLLESDGIKAYIPSMEEQIIIITIHRLYRHLSFKISDIVNATALLMRGNFNWERLFELADECGIMKGVNYLLGILEGVHISYSGHGFLPDRVKKSVYRKAELSFRHYFFRIPLFRVPPRLYAAEAFSFLKRGKLGGLARLSLVPILSGMAYATIKLFKDDWVW